MLILFTHQPTSVVSAGLFTTQERERIQTEARRLGPSGEPTNNQAAIDAGFPLTHPDWEFNSIEGTKRLLAYQQALLVGLKAATCQPTNLAKVFIYQKQKQQ